MSRCLIIATSMLLLPAVLGGCNGSGARTVPVSGKVTFAGGPPPTNGSITFNPITVPEGMPRRPGTAQFDKDGSFTVTSFQTGDGLLPGTYHPNVSCWKGTPDSNDPSSFERLNYVPRDYRPEPITVSPDDDEVTVVINIPRQN